MCEYRSLGKENFTFICPVLKTVGRPILKSRLFKIVCWFATLYCVWFERNGSHGGHTQHQWPTSLLIDNAHKETGLPDMVSLPDLSAWGTVIPSDTPRSPYQDMQSKRHANVLCHGAVWQSEIKLHVFFTSTLGEGKSLAPRLGHFAPGKWRR
jgi:hypothetical protein